VDPAAQRHPLRGRRRWLSGDHPRDGTPPEPANLSAPGWDSSDDWAWEGQRNMGNASGHSGWRIRARVGLAMARGGEGDSGATASAVPALEGAYGPLHLVQRKRGVERVLTVLWVEGKAGAVCSATRIGGGGEQSSRPGSRKRCAGLLDASDRRGVLLRW